jgi:hypothetical protein
MPLFSDIEMKVIRKFTLLYHPRPDKILSLHSFSEKFIVAQLVTFRLFPSLLSINVRVEVYNRHLTCLYFVRVTNLISQRKEITCI